MFFLIGEPLHKRSRVGGPLSSTIQQTPTPLSGLLPFTAAPTADEDVAIPSSSTAALALIAPTVGNSDAAIPSTAAAAVSESEYAAIPSSSSATAAALIVPNIGNADAAIPSTAAAADIRESEDVAIPSASTSTAAASQAQAVFTGAIENLISPIDGQPRQILGILSLSIASYGAKF